MPNTSLKKIMIVGGGTAGWMSAVYLAKVWKKYNLDIHIIESATIGTIGVGEGTTPSIKTFFDTLGIDAKEWMPACNATFKTGIRFIDWSPSSGQDSYFHPFYSQLDEYFQHEFSQNINLRHRGFDVHTHPDEFLLANTLAKESKAPIAPKSFPFDTAYAFHFDAGLLAAYLKQKAQAWGITHHVATINNVNLAEDGSIKSVTTETGETHNADFFIDCSGFGSMLLGRTLNVPYVSFENSLLNDSAVTIATETEDVTPCLTTSTALSAGWAWRIPLTNRFGNGYVYSSKYITPEAAEAELKAHLGLPSSTKANHLQMRVGRFSKGWEKNCIAIGLAQGFIEPLEATALHFVSQSITDFVDAYETADMTDANRDLYNEKLEDRFECVRDYIELHYITNSRDDTPYWKASRSHKASPRLQKIINAFNRGESVLKVLEEEAVSLQMFAPESWLCLLAGKGIFPESYQDIKLLPEALRVDMDRVNEFVKTCSLHYPSHDSALAELKHS